MKCGQWDKLGNPAIRVSSWSEGAMLRCAHPGCGAEIGFPEDSLEETVEYNLYKESTGEENARKERVGPYHKIGGDEELGTVVPRTRETDSNGERVRYGAAQRAINKETEGAKSPDVEKRDAAHAARLTQLWERCHPKNPPVDPGLCDTPPSLTDALEFYDLIASAFKYKFDPRTVDTLLVLITRATRIQEIETQYPAGSFAREQLKDQIREEEWKAMVINPDGADARKMDKRWTVQKKNVLAWRKQQLRWVGTGRKERLEFKLSESKKKKRKRKEKQEDQQKQQKKARVDKESDESESDQEIVIVISSHSHRHSKKHA
jgi:hypothetical protein